MTATITAHSVAAPARPAVYPDGALASFTALGLAILGSLATVVLVLLVL
ncbi:hypothetical protein [Methylobacterium sp. JK268]